MGSGLDPNVSPGIGGFIAFFLLACALWLLMRNMLKHLRSVDYREEREERARMDAAASQSPPAGDDAQRDVTVPGAEGGRDEDRDDDVVTRPSSLSAGYPGKHKK